MRFLTQFWIFYKKLIIPSFAVSLGIALLGMGLINVIPGFGIAFIFITPLFHFIFYDLANPKEYYFYFNMGLSKMVLWGGTLVLSSIVGIIFIII